MKKEKIPKFRKYQEDKNNKKIIFLVSAILIIILIVLVYFFAHKYFLNKKQINKLFENIKEVEPDTEFESSSFSILIDACVGKEIGNSCNYEFGGKTKKGICSLSKNNESVCIS